jgi:hypothetical protein
METAIKRNLTKKEKYKKVFTQSKVMQKQALEIQSKNGGITKSEKDNSPKTYGMIRMLSRMAVWA